MGDSLVDTGSASRQVLSPVVFGDSFSSSIQAAASRPEARIGGLGKMENGFAAAALWRQCHGNPINWALYLQRFWGLVIRAGDTGHGVQSMGK